MRFALIALVACLCTVQSAKINVNFANLLADSTIPAVDPSDDTQVVINPQQDADGVAVNFAYMLNGVDCVSAPPLVSCHTENAYSFEQTQPDPYVSTMPGLCRWSAEPGRAAACVRPAGNLDVSIEVRNTGLNSWNRRDITLQLGGEESFTFPYWKKSTLYLSEDVGSGEVGTFHGVLKAPSVPGVFSLSWQGVSSCGRFGNITGTVEVTCSDGIYCNGMERFIGGRCQAAPFEQCDDRTNCTRDICDEEAQFCSHELLQGPGCVKCNTGEPCTPYCAPDQECGYDGCGGTCGVGADCAAGKACSGEGICIQPTNVGSCGNPIPLVESGTPLLGHHVLHIDTSLGVDEVTPTCNKASTAGELIFRFTVPAGRPLGIDVRMFNHSTLQDTVLELRQDTCQDKRSSDVPFVETGAGQNVWCSDDATPPGDTGSRIATLLQPGTYYLIADAYSVENVGPCTIDVTFVDNYVPQCLSRFCGDDGHGGSCGACDDDQICSEHKRCIAAECPEDVRCLVEIENDDGNGTITTDSYQAECGYDRCDRGGHCGPMDGKCPEGLFCVQDTGKCEEMPVCNHLVPTCSNCGDDEFCGSDCACHKAEDRWADLTIDKKLLNESILWDYRTFDNVSCAIVEQCVDGIGERRLVKFGVAVANIGNAALQMPNPHERPDEFVFATCHNHYHYNGFATYRLIQNGVVVRKGHKQAYCLEDSIQYDGQVGPDVPCRGSTECEAPGLSQGWFDTYGNDLDCQWIDITGVPSGTYTLRVDINTARQMQESSYENNSAEIQIFIAP